MRVLRAGLFQDRHGLPVVIEGSYSELIDNEEAQRAAVAAARAKRPDASRVVEASTPILDFASGLYRRTFWVR